MSDSALQRLLELQEVDTRLDRLGLQRRNAPEHQQLEAARSAVQQAAQWRAQRQARLAAIDERIAANEAESSQLDVQRARLQSQLRTVIAPREAEALMHEIDTVNARRGELDDSELTALEEQDQIVADLDVDEAEEPGRVQAAGAAQAALDHLLTAIDADIASATSEREQLLAGIPDAFIARYERLRSKLDGVAVARLDGKRCSGCHLDLSAGELDTVRHPGPGEIVECPQCSRLLVR